MKGKIKAVPSGYRTVTPYLTARGAAALLDFVKRAFGATVMEQMDSPGVGLVHAAVKIGDSLVMLGEAMGNMPPMPAAVYLYVDDADAVYRRALEAGATSVMEPANQFWGDRHGGVKDAFGNCWWIATHVEDVPPAEMKRRGEEFMKKAQSQCTKPTPSADAVVIERVFDAPREKVFQAWTDPKRKQRWWGPRGFTNPVCQVDARPGGSWFICMRAPDGTDYWCKGVYREVVAPARIVTTDCFADKQGNTVPASQYGMCGDWPLELLVTVTFEDLGGRTKLTLNHSGVGGISDTDRRSMQQGWSESFDKLAELLAGG